MQRKGERRSYEEKSFRFQLPSPYTFLLYRLKRAKTHSQKVRLRNNLDFQNQRLF